MAFKMFQEFLTASLPLDINYYQNNSHWLISVRYLHYFLFQKLYVTLPAPFKVLSLHPHPKKRGGGGGDLT